MRAKTTTERDAAVFYLNGKRLEVSGEKAGWMLADYLRYQAGLTGTKIVCAEGDCGACSVLRFFPAAGQNPSYYVPINSCIATVAQMDGSSLVTVEYLGGENLDPIQKEMVKAHASQCGFCTPGFVIAIKGLTEAGKSEITERRVKNALTGNLCRCTGYKQILDAALAVPLNEVKPLSQSPWHEEMQKDLNAVSKKALRISTPHYQIFAPVTLKAAAQYLKKFKNARVLGAGTDLGVALNKGKIGPSPWLSLHLIPELYRVKRGKKRLWAGARVTMEILRRDLEKDLPKFSSFLDIFASPQIKNVATLVGNVCNASPIGDTLPLLLALNATVHITGNKNRKVPLETFFLDYRKTALKAGELVFAIEFDIPSESETLQFYKSSQRKDLDISAVNGAIRLTEGNIRVAFGGVAGIPLRVKPIEIFLKNKKLDEKVIEETVSLLQKEIKPLSDARGSSAFRRILAANFLRESLKSEMHREGRIDASS